MKQRRVAPWIAGAVALILNAIVLNSATSSPATERIADSPLLGRPAPAASGDIVAGPTGTLADLRGKYVIVNFFATWCVPCRREHPELVQFAARHAERADAAVLQVVYGDRVPTVKAFLDKNGGPWTVLDDPKGTIALAWGVRGLPESYLVDPDGVVQAKITGGATADGMESLLKRVERAA
jgi:cytochrome c biogenesis protein CcmG/thiol:disulfide interchange protein DsbE